MISSRTPEGSPYHCPVCGQDVCIEPTLPSGDAPCPNCGHLLWFIRNDKLALVLSDAQWAQLVKDLGADSLDMVELVMELEEKDS